MQNHKPNHNRPSLFLSSYTTKLDQIQYATLFQPNKKIHVKNYWVNKKKLPKLSKFDFDQNKTFFSSNFFDVEQ